MSTPKHILVTGGAGFVGSNLCVALRAAFPESVIVAMDNLYRKGSELNVPRLQSAGIEFHHGDVRNPHDFPERPFDFVIECSAEPSVLAGHGGSPDYLIGTNLVGAYNCLEKARAWQSRFIFLSTSRVYPIARLESHPWEELDRRFSWKDKGVEGISSAGVSEDVAMDGARSLYGYTKLSAEQLIEEYRVAYGLKAVIDRFGVIAGPWQFGKSDQGIAAYWVMAHRLGLPVSYIGYGGTGKQVRDMLHVADACDLIVEQVRDFDRWEGWVGNVSGGASNSVSLAELTTLCQEITGRTISIGCIAENRPFDLRIYIGDTSKLDAKTSWRPRRTVREIVSDVNRWVGEHETELKKIYGIIT